MAPPGATLFFLFVLPMGVMAVFSFRLGTFGAERDLFTLVNYQSYLENTSYHLLLLKSVLLALETSILAIVLAYPVAYYLASHAGPRRISLLTLLLVPAWTSYLLRILAWRLMLSSGGPINSILLTLGLIQEATPILLYTRTAVVITLVYSWIPFVALPIFSALDRIDPSLGEAASDLGGRPWRSFQRITLPLSMPGVIAGFFIIFIPTLGEWVTPLLVGGINGFMYGNAIQDQFVRALNWPLGAVMSFVLLILVLILMFAFSRVGRITDMTGV
jgi:spermidine/putrescine transport system permease protein